MDTVITDPPYSSGGTYRGDRMGSPTAKYVQTESGTGNNLATFSGDNRDQRAYLTWCTLWLEECLRVTKPGGACLLFTDWRQLPITTDALQAGGWVWRGIVPWYKPNGRRQQGRFSNNCEYIVWGTAGARPAAAVPGALNGFFQVSTLVGASKVHIAEKPIPVMRELVKICPEGGTILDPFTGSGATGVAAVLEGRRFIGVEITKHYARLAQDRIDSVTVTATTNDGLFAQRRDPAAP